MPGITALRSSILAAAMLIMTAAVASPQTADDLFSLDTVHQIRVMMSSRDLQLMLDRYEENIFFPADVQWGSLRARNVGVRVRGRASRIQGKPGLQLDFSRYVSRQRFLGLDSLVLDNRWQDTSLFRERVSMAFFSRMGIAAPRESFARVYINNVFYGLYAIVEGIDASFLERAFQDRNGYLFEYQNVRPYYGEYLGEDFEEYKPFFEARTRRLDADTLLYSPIHDLFREINHADDAVWRERVERYLDIEQLLTYVAIETFLAEPDGFLGFAGMSNFYLYRPANSQQHRLLPWDKDLSFENLEFDLFRRADSNELFRRLMAYEDLRARYLQRIEDCVHAAVADDWLEHEVRRTAALVAEAAYEDERKAWTNEDFDAAVEYLLEFARLRPGFVMKEIEAARDAR